MEHTDRSDDTPGQPITPDVAAGNTPGNNGHGGQGASADYGADKIKVLEGLEAVRKLSLIHI